MNPLQKQNICLLVSITILAILPTGCSVDPDIALSHQLTEKGNSYFSAKELDKAINAWKKALNYKQRAELYERIVTAYIIKNNLSYAEIWTSKGLTDFPNNANLIFNRALISFYNGDFDSARKDLDKVLEINRYSRNVHLLKGLMYEKEGNIAAANKEFVNEINVNPGSRSAWKKIREAKK